MSGKDVTLAVARAAQADGSSWARVIAQLYPAAYADDPRPAAANLVGPEYDRARQGRSSVWRVDPVEGECLII